MGSTPGEWLGVRTCFLWLVPSWESGRRGRRPSVISPGCVAGGCRLAGLVAAEGGSEVVLLYGLALVRLYLQSLTFHIKLKSERCGDTGMGRIDLAMGQGLVWIGG